MSLAGSNVGFSKARLEAFINPGQSYNALVIAFVTSAVVARTVSKPSAITA